MSNVDIMMIGHFAKDKLVIDGRSEHASGGAIYYGGYVLCHLGTSVAIVTRMHPNDYHFLDELRRMGAQIYISSAHETTGIENIYNTADMERRICKPLGFAGAFQHADIPDIAARIYAVTPIIAGEVDLGLLDKLSARGLIALDIQGFVRVRNNGELEFQMWPEINEGLSKITYLKVDRAEAELLTGQTDLRYAAKKLAEYGPREVLITHSSGVTVFADGDLIEAPFTPRSLRGRTGRGDTCFATYLAKRLNSSPEEACRTAAAVATLKQEQPGPWNGDKVALQELLSR